MFLYIKVSSKDKQILKKFTNFLFKLETLIFNLKCFPKQKKRKFITVLKSPHVNKTAQEQFEFRFYNKQFFINSLTPFIFLYLLKRIKNTSFSGMRLEIKILSSHKDKMRSFLKSINPDYAILDNSSCLIKRDVSLAKYIQLFDGYGEIFLKHFCFESSSFK